ncbi:MAG: diguanylate cyclase [Gammaproteobacteria bacterium]|nr:diguanylate cyclase [Gammaproteobacteria bacterium]
MGKVARKALIASDEPHTRRELETALLTAGFQTLSVDSTDEAIDALDALPSMEIILVDELLRGKGAAHLFEHLAKSAVFENTIKILINSQVDNDHARKALALSVDDCIAKPIQADELKLRLALWKKLGELAGKVATVASHDQVTGLYSHGLILETAQHELDRAARDETPLSVLLTDIDNLRQINEHFGHQMGDKVLSSVAQRLKVALRSYDLSGRFGGEEFLTVLPRCGRANAMEVGERVRRAVAAEPFLIDSIKMNVTVSVGVATTMGDERVAARRIIRAADHALYKAKREGRNRVEMAVSLKTWAGQSN